MTAAVQEMLGCWGCSRNHPRLSVHACINEIKQLMRPGVSDIIFRTQRICTVVHKLIVGGIETANIYSDASQVRSTRLHFAGRIRLGINILSSRQAIPVLTPVGRHHILR